MPKGQLSWTGFFTCEVAVEPVSCLGENGQVASLRHAAFDAIAKIAVVFEPTPHNRFAVACNGKRANEVRLVLRAVDRHVESFLRMSHEFTPASV